MTRSISLRLHETAERASFRASRLVLGLKNVFYESFYERSLLFHVRFSKMDLTQSHVALL